MKNIRLFWLSFKDHPGLPWLWMWPLMMLFGIAGRKDFTSFTDLQSGAIIGCGAISLLPLIPILITAWTGRHEYTCRTCGGHGEISGFQHGAAPGYVSEPCPDCNPGGRIDV